MPLPELTDSGELPPGEHGASLRETLGRFGVGELHAAMDAVREVLVARGSSHAGVRVDAGGRAALESQRGGPKSASGSPYMGNVGLTNFSAERNIAMRRPPILAVLVVMGAALAVPSHATAAPPRVHATEKQRAQKSTPRVHPTEKQRAQKSTPIFTKGKPVFEVPVSDNPSTGYTVALESTSKGIYLVDVTAESPGRPMPGAPSRKVFHFFTTMKPSSEGRIVFVRFRQWEFDKTVSEETYEVHHR
jgi:hypothetical protein